jgi:alkylation response protein AidB-like acyl-CoA dehydrogenase
VGYDPRFLDAQWPGTEHLLSQVVLEKVQSASWQADERGELSVTGLDAIRDSDYVAAPIPEEFEGRGASLLECAALQRRIALADAGLAIALNMHLFSVGVIVEHWRRERDHSWMLLEAIASQGRIVASAFAEPGLNGSILRSNMATTRGPDGYFVTGTKTPCSLAAASDLVCLQFEADDAAGRELLIALIPTQAAGLAVERTWRSLGMRGSGSDTLRFDSVSVHDDLVFHRCTPGFDDDPVFAAGLCWFAVTTVASYLGVAQAALEETVATLGAPGSSRGDHAIVHGQLGDAVAQLASLTVAVTGLAAQLDAHELDPRLVLPVALAVREQAVPGILGAIGLLLEVCGGGAYRAPGVLERCVRDAEALRFHPPTPLATRQLLGRLVLGHPFTFELAARPAGDGS